MRQRCRYSLQDEDMQGDPKKDTAAEYCSCMLYINVNRCRTVRHTYEKEERIEKKSLG